jgi:hypothetical protein
LGRDVIEFCEQERRHDQKAGRDDGLISPRDAPGA